MSLHAWERNPVDRRNKTPSKSHSDKRPVMDLEVGAIHRCGTVRLGIDSHKEHGTRTGTKPGFSEWDHYRRGSLHTNTSRSDTGLFIQTTTVWNFAPTSERSCWPSAAGNTDVVNIRRPPGVDLIYEFPEHIYDIRIMIRSFLCLWQL